MPPSRRGHRQASAPPRFAAGSVLSRICSVESQLAFHPAPAASFTAEQKAYLKGFFAALSQRGLAPFAGHTSSGQITNDPASAASNMAAEELGFNTPVSDLCREERWKFEENPLDIWD